MRAVTVWVPAEVDEWFTFHESEAEHEEQDQRKLEDQWGEVACGFARIGKCRRSD